MNMYRKGVFNNTLKACLIEKDKRLNQVDEGLKLILK